MGGEKKNPARENSRTDKSLCNGTFLVAVHLAKVADQFQENIEIMVFVTLANYGCCRRAGLDTFFG